MKISDLSNQQVVSHDDDNNIHMDNGNKDEKNNIVSEGGKEKIMGDNHGELIDVNQDNKESQNLSSSLMTSGPNIVSSIDLNKNNNEYKGDDGFGSSDAVMVDGDLEKKEGLAVDNQDSGGVTEVSIEEDNKSLETENSENQKEDLVKQAISVKDGVNFVDLTKIKISFQILKLIAKDAAYRYRMVAFDRDGQKLKVAMLNSNDVDALNALRFIANKFSVKTEIYKADEGALEKALEGYDQADILIDSAVTDYEKTEAEIKEERAKKFKEKIDAKELSSAPVAKIVDVIINHAIIGKASDIHIEPQEDKLRVRYRVDGDLFESFSMAKNISSAVVSRVKILANLKIDEKRKPQDGRIRVENAKGEPMDVRVSSMPTAEGEKIVMRLLEKQSGLADYTNLGILGRNREVLEKAILNPYGIILVTGPTGSGKSTTIFASLNKLNDIRSNIVTLEDPVEYKVAGVNHCQVQPEIGFTFAAGLRSILRQDPDVIMVGEIRDGETAELAIHAALTGHLVLSTLHTNDALGAIPRLVDMGSEAFLLSSSLRAVVAQRLIRRICEKCKEQVSPSEAERNYVLEGIKLIKEDEIKKYMPEFNKDDFKIWKGKGCAHCRNSGSKGRIGIYEMVECDKELRSVIDSSLNNENLYNEFRRQGAVFMQEDGILKALAGFTTLEAVEEATSEDEKDEKK